ncbi:hypothetical protein C1645_839384 [Glomus cerebriforme]|uniref:Uncharacterized protein n=1 Tax=Glomus cerebriforme TaxID=658196 RepID=A0A397S247_9GLOM|nr:hypothetical protein C1645_839384 [Glomus cerebriforme]
MCAVVDSKPEDLKEENEISKEKQEKEAKNIIKKPYNHPRNTYPSMFPSRASLIAELINLNPQYTQYSTALEMCAGDRLYIFNA